MPRRRRAQAIRPGLRRILDGMTESPAFVRNGRLDILAVNRLGRALCSPVFVNPARPVNLARFRFLDPASMEFYPDWEDSASTTVNLLRTEAGRDPYNKALTDLVGELSTRSDEFRVRWAAHDVRLHHTGVKRFHHPIVGELTLAFEAMPLPAYGTGLLHDALGRDPVARRRRTIGPTRGRGRQRRHGLPTLRRRCAGSRRPSLPGSIRLRSWTR